MKIILIATTALALAAAPAQAQLLGGAGGLGGTLGGSIGGTFGGGGSVGSTMDKVRSTSHGTLEASGSASGSAKADRRSGRVDTEGTGTSSANGNLGSMADLPGRTIETYPSAGGSGSGGGSVSTQLIGTDAVRNSSRSALSEARGAAGEARAAARGSAQKAGSAASTTAGDGAGQTQGSTARLAGGAGNLSGGVQGATKGSAQGANTGMPASADGARNAPLAASGIVSGEGSGGFLVERGTPIFDGSGDRIGRVRQILTNSRGHVERLLVRVDGKEAVLPAGNFEAGGRGLISAMGESEIKQVADEQGQSEQPAS